MKSVKMHSKIKRTVYLGDDVAVIGASAFENCTNLETVVMPGVTTINENAFRGCSKFEPILWDCVTYIGSGAFDGITAASVFIPRDTVVEADTFGTYNGTIRTTQDSALVKVVSGGVYNITIRESALRIISEPGGLSFEEDYKNGLNVVNGNYIRAWVEGVEAGEVMYRATMQLKEGQNTLADAEFESDMVYFEPLDVNRSMFRETYPKRFVFVVRVDSPDGEKRYITSNVLLVP